MSLGTSVLIILTAGAGVAVIPVLIGLGSRLVDPDFDWGAPVFLAAGLLIAFVFVASPVAAVLAAVGARTAAGVIAVAEVVAMAAVCFLLLLMRLR